MPKVWSAKRERQYEQIKDSLEERGTTGDKAEEIAARASGSRAGRRWTRSSSGARSTGSAEDVVGILAPVRPKTLDHVALWVAERDSIADLTVERLGMHVIERTDRFTLVGSDARRGKLTLFDAEGPRERGALKRVGLRVSSLDGREPELSLGEGLEVVLVEAPTDVEFDLDHVQLFSADPAVAAGAWEAYGLARVGETRLEVGGAFVEIHPGEPGDPERPLLNHLAVLVDSVDEHVAAAEERGIEVADVVDAPNTLALFVWGPDRVKLEYVEHKPSFSLS